MGVDVIYVILCVRFVVGTKHHNYPILWSLGELQDLQDVHNVLYFLEKSHMEFACPGDRTRFVLVESQYDTTELTRPWIKFGYFNISLRLPPKEIK